MELQNDITRGRLLERFVDITSFWAESTNLYSIDINNSRFYETRLASQIRGLWNAYLGRIMRLLNYQSNFAAETDSQSVISYFATTCVLISFDCCDNHSTTLRDISRILFSLISA